MRKVIISRNRGLYSAVKELMEHWGFGETCSSIYALLFVSEKPLTAEEVAQELGYAYSSMVNELNKLRKDGLISRERNGGRKYVYVALRRVDFILLKEKEKALSILSRIYAYLQEHDDFLNNETRASVEKSINIVKRGVSK